jgi:hypothetical protein
MGSRLSYFPTGRIIGQVLEDRVRRTPFRGGEQGCDPALTVRLNLSHGGADWFLPGSQVQHNSGRVGQMG